MHQSWWEIKVQTLIIRIIFYNNIMAHQVLANLISPIVEKQRETFIDKISENVLYVYKLVVLDTQRLINNQCVAHFGN